MNHPTDAELDRDWQPNGRRPQSTIARSFSAELEDIFKLEGSLSDMDSDLDKRKHQVTTQTTELQALEARIKEMEERLKRQAGGNAAPTQQRQTMGNTFNQPAQTTTAAGADKSRPGTAKPQQQQQAPIRGGALPPTPTASEGEYDHVDDPTIDGDQFSAGVETQSFTDFVLVSKDGGDRDN